MKIHFIGIGGIGVSALAKYFLEKSHQVSGSDLVSSEMTKDLKKRRAKIYIGKHKTKNLPKDADLVIYSSAIQKNNPELKVAKKLEIKCQSYPQTLGKLTKQYFTIAVSGTHGKSTTTAMIGLLLMKAGFDPTVIVGTKLKEFGDSNYRVGKSKYLVIEADEHFASFLNYWPKIIVLTNIEKEHLDYYKNLRNILRTYKEYINHLPADGILVANKDDRNISKIQIKNQKFRIINYSIKRKKTKKLRKILKIPGEHNVSNALAALAVAQVLKIPDKISFETISKYKGAWRRFEEKELKIVNCKLKIISDYAHHPTEIKATLKAAREKYPARKIWCVFQPHQYQRTYYLFNDFVKSFKESLNKNWIEKLILTDIYDVAGREDKKTKKKMSSKKLVEAIKGGQDTRYIPTMVKIRNYLRKNLQGREVVIIMGAGDIYHLTNGYR